MLRYWLPFCFDNYMIAVRSRLIGELYSGFRVPNMCQFGKQAKHRCGQKSCKGKESYLNEIFFQFNLLTLPVLIPDEEKKLT